MLFSINIVVYYMSTVPQPHFLLHNIIVVLYGSVIIPQLKPCVLLLNHLCSHLKDHRNIATYVDVFSHTIISKWWISHTIHTLFVAFMYNLHMFASVRFVSTWSGEHIYLQVIFYLLMALSYKVMTWKLTRAPWLENLTMSRRERTKTPCFCQVIVPTQPVVTVERALHFLVWVLPGQTSACGRW